MDAQPTIEEAMDALVARLGVSFGRVVLSVTDGKVVQVEASATHKNVDLGVLKSQPLFLAGEADVA